MWGLPVNARLALLQLVEDMCLHKMAGQLYSNLQQECDAHISAQLAKLAADQTMDPVLALEKVCGNACHTKIALSMPTPAGQAKVGRVFVRWNQECLSRPQRPPAAHQCSAVTHARLAARRSSNSVLQSSSAMLQYHVISASASCHASLSCADCCMLEGPLRADVDYPVHLPVPGPHLCHQHLWHSFPL